MMLRRALVLGRQRYVSSVIGPRSVRTSNVQVAWLSSGSSRRKKLFDKVQGKVTSSEGHGWDDVNVPTKQMEITKPAQDGLLMGDQFKKEASEMIARVTAGMRSLANENPGMRTENENGNAVRVSFRDDSNFEVEIQEHEDVILLKSPISGHIKYAYSTRNGKWIGVLDGHDFVGLLTRDVMRVAYGVPNF